MVDLAAGAAAGNIMESMSLPSSDKSIIYVLVLLVLLLSMACVMLLRRGGRVLLTGEC